MLDESGKGKGALQKFLLFLAEFTNSELYNLVNCTGTYLLIAIHFCNNRHSGLPRKEIWTCDSQKPAHIAQLHSCVFADPFIHVPMPNVIDERQLEQS